jgi:Domain of unknown function (DUF4279)
MQERGCSLNEQAIREAAIAEILRPTLPITRQFLEVNKVVLKERVPIVEDVILREEEKTAEVYFPIEGERYYLVVYLDVQPRVALRWMGMSAGNRVYFYTKSGEHQVDELVAMAGVEPTRTWEKGKHIRHHGFEVRPSFKETGDVEDKLRTIISFLLPYTANVHALSAIADVGINIAYWGYKEQMWGIHFGTDIIQGLAVLNLSVDVDLYASGSDLGAY